ncbi:3-hydroxyisobutyryl-CoA hydrolase-like protein 2, mitochondrial [Vitis vinifera]|uniref:3-hydroxyisobutyryl-CoA hydrolase n=1 Tax=Vitis vinifera TaxID=29760 RepID=A0A438CJX6_VITVI|nr:3-hydroxyisobutyryl-CoA hydrolase-like protein 2, mitochondrial [Vitis vinifera]
MTSITGNASFGMLKPLNVLYRTHEMVASGLSQGQQVFATPETQMGFHPDAGASFYLSRLPGYLGEYLALTGEKLNGVEMIACGLATHYSLTARLPLIEERLGKLITDDPSVIESSLEQYGDLVYPDKRSVLHKIETIDKCFCHDTVEEIINALWLSAARFLGGQDCPNMVHDPDQGPPSRRGKRPMPIKLPGSMDKILQYSTFSENEASSSYDEWSATALKKLKEASPLSLKVTLRSIREGRFQPLDQCLAREYRISLVGITKRVSDDFCEGVRARLVDKDFAPKWDPPSLGEVTKDMVDCYFTRLNEFEPELELPTALREPYM